MKRCPKCQTTRTLLSFHRDRSRKDGLQPWCRPCVNVAKAKWLERNLDKARAYSREWARANRNKAEHCEKQKAWWKKNGHRYKGKAGLAKYGLTLEAFRLLLSGQGGVCAICLKPCMTGQRLAVDHDHVTGVVRGLLCRKCNIGIGHFGEDPAVLLRAIEYLAARRERLAS